MIIRFKNKHIRDICNDENLARVELPDNVVNNLQILLHKLNLYDTFNLIRNRESVRKYRIHLLKGKKQEIFSFSLDRKYRMTLTVSVEKDFSGKDIVTILEVTNHYGD